jgi:hypothetical protein
MAASDPVTLDAEPFPLGQPRTPILRNDSSSPRRTFRVESPVPGASFAAGDNSMRRDSGVPADPRVMSRRGHMGTGATDGPDSLHPEGTTEVEVVAEVGDGLGAAVDLELLEDVVDVVLHGGDFDAEAAGDLFVRQALGQELQDLQFAAGEGAQRWLGAVAGRQGRDPAEQGPSDPGGAAHLAASDALDGGHEFGQ